MDVTASREQFYSTSPRYHKGRRAYTKILIEEYKLSFHRDLFRYPTLACPNYNLRPYKAP